MKSMYVTGGRRCAPADRHICSKLQSLTGYYHVGEFPGKIQRRIKARLSDADDMAGAAVNANSGKAETHVSADEKAVLENKLPFPGTADDLSAYAFERSKEDNNDMG